MPTIAKPFVDLLGSLYGKLAAEKLRVCWSRDGDKRWARCFIGAVDSAHLAQPSNRVASYNGLELPVAFWMVRLPQCTRMIAKAVRAG